MVTTPHDAGQRLTTLHRLVDELSVLVDPVRYQTANTDRTFDRIDPDDRLAHIHSTSVLVAACALEIGNDALQTTIAGLTLRGPTPTSIILDELSEVLDQ